MLGRLCHQYGEMVGLIIAVMSDVFSLAKMVENLCFEQM